MLKRLILTTAMSLVALSSAWAEDKLPVTAKDVLGASRLL